MADIEEGKENVAAGNSNGKEEILEDSQIIQ